ncbi:hypothetical protein DNF23_54725, partial [Pseudomonas syringae pv. pisi]
VTTPLAHSVRKLLNLLRNFMKLDGRMRGHLNCQLPFDMANDGIGLAGLAQRFDQRLPPYITVITHASILGGSSSRLSGQFEVFDGCERQQDSSSTGN